MNEKVYGPVTRKLLDAWKNRNGCNVTLSRGNVRSLFNDINLYPSRNQVNEWIYCARGNLKSNNKIETSDYLMFGEFCFFATELKRHYAALSKKKRHQNCGSLIKSRKSKRLKSSPTYEVFLGGSCNPTTWRNDIVIPFLKSNEITYYNPQQPDWNPEMIKKENNAKQTSQILFFVLSKVTRNVVAMLEVAYMSGRKRDLIVMLESYPGLGHKINGEVLSFTEINDLENAMGKVHDFVERQGFPVFDTIETAMICLGKVIKQNVCIRDFGLKDSVQPVKFAHIQIGDSLVRLKETFDSLDTTKSGQISLKELTIAFRIHSGKKLNRKEQQQIIGSLQDGSKVAKDDLSVNFEDLCKIVSEYHPKKVKHCLPNLFSKRQQNLMLSEDQILQRSVTQMDPEGISHRDVYLGGTVDTTNTWRNAIAIPELKKNALTFHNPETLSDCSRLFDTSMDNAKLLLFVILGNSLSVKAMCEAAYYIGCGRNVVLCLEKMDEFLIIEGNQLSSEAWKDFSRGRSYLDDMANREGIPIFDDINEAVNCVIHKCKNCLNGDLIRKN